MIGFQKWINLIFSYIIEGNKIVFSYTSLQKTNYLKTFNFKGQCYD